MTASAPATRSARETLQHVFGYAEFRGASQASRLKLMGVEVSTLGVPIGEADAGSMVTS